MSHSSYHYPSPVDDNELLRMVTELYGAQAHLQSACDHLRRVEASLHDYSLRDPSVVHRARYMYEAFCSRIQHAVVPPGANHGPYGLPSPTTPSSSVFAVPQQSPYPPPLNSLKFHTPIYPTGHDQFAAAFESACPVTIPPPVEVSGPAGVTPSLIYTPSPPTSTVELTPEYFLGVPPPTSPDLETLPTSPQVQEPEVVKSPLVEVLPISLTRRKYEEDLQQVVFTAPDSSFLHFERDPQPHRACRVAGPSVPRERSASVLSLSTAPDLNHFSEAPAILVEAESQLQPSPDREEELDDDDDDDEEADGDAEVEAEIPEDDDESTGSEGFVQHRSKRRAKGQKKDTRRPKTTRGRNGDAAVRRHPRQVVYEPSVVFPVNAVHRFVAVQVRDQADISERLCTELFLNPARCPAYSPLATSFAANTVYSDVDYESDAAHGTVYHFTTLAGEPWTATFTASGAVAQPVGPEHTRDLSADYRLIVFSPGTMTGTPDDVIGSMAWWRLQACAGTSKHRGMPGDGEWTARWDADSRDRRPARIVAHFSSCRFRRTNLDALGQLARLVLAK